MAGTDDRSWRVSGFLRSAWKGPGKIWSAEIKGWNFDRVRSSAYSAWNEQLSAVRIEGGEPSRREVFYTSLYYAMLYPMLYPMLYSDVTGEYRSSDSKVYRGDFRYFAGVLSLWDTFRRRIR